MRGRSANRTGLPRGCETVLAQAANVGLQPNGQTLIVSSPLAVLQQVTNSQVARISPKLKVLLVIADKVQRGGCLVTDTDEAPAMIKRF